MALEQRFGPSIFLHTGAPSWILVNVLRQFWLGRMELLAKTLREFASKCLQYSAPVMFFVSRSGRIDTQGLCKVSVGLKAERTWCSGPSGSSGSLAVNVVVIKTLHRP